MSLPLSKVRVLDLTQTLSGPFGSMILGDLGAEVIKVENPAGPDVARRTPPHFVGGESLYYLSLNRNKKSLAMDLKTGEGRRLFLRLVERSDVVMENFRPGVMDRLGVGWEQLSRANPRIILCSLSGYGSAGPWRDRPGYDYLVQALSGLMMTTGDPKGPPTKTGVSVVDHLGGIYAALAVLAALYRREATGEGGHIDLSLMDCTLSLFSYLAASLLNAGDMPTRTRNSAHPYIVPCQLFSTRDGYLMVMVMNDRFWRNFCTALERPDLTMDARFETMAQRFEHRETLLTLVEPILAERTTEEWLRRFEAADVPAAPVAGLGDALACPQVQMRGMVREFRHPGYGSVQVVGNPIKLSGMEERFEPAPRLGEHSAEVLSTVLGLSDEEIRRLEASHVIYCGR